MHEQFDRVAFHQIITNLNSRLTRAPAEIDANLKQTQRLRTDVTKHLTAMLVDIDGLLPAPEGAVAPNDDTDIQTATAVAADMQDQMRQQIGKAASCMQYPDAFRQRGENVQSIVDMAAGQSKASSHALMHVAAAQCDDMADELEAVAQSAIAALRAMMAQPQPRNCKVQSPLMIGCKISSAAAPRLLQRWTT